MLMILYKFNHATAVRGGYGGGGMKRLKLDQCALPNPLMGLQSRDVGGNATDFI